MPAEHVQNGPSEQIEQSPPVRLPEYLRESFHAHIRTLVAEKKIELYAEPDVEAKIRNIVRPLARDEKDRLALEAFMDQKAFSAVVETLLLNGSSVRRENIITYVKKLLEDPGILDSRTGVTPITWPSPVLSTNDYRVEADVAKQSMAIIGDGAAGLLMGRMRAELGYDPSSTKIFSQTGKHRGIWDHERVVNEGHNTFATASAFGYTLSAAGKRTGPELQAFLDGIAQKLDTSFVRGKVQEVRFDPAVQKYVISYTGESGNLLAQEIDSVCVCTGNRLPRRLDAPSAPMLTSAMNVPKLPLNRWQEQIPPEKADLYRGRSPVVVGLGNSAMAMIGEFLKLEKAGVEVNPVILTHLSRLAVRKPKEFVPGRDEMPERVHRDRFDLSRVAGDIPEIEARYREALERGWIVSDVKRWDAWHEGEPERGNVQVKVETYDGHVRNIPNVPMIFALIGYQNDPAVMQQLGCTLADADGTVDYELPTHRVVGHRRLFVLGAAASSRENRNEEVIPGIMDAVGKIAFTEIVHAYQNRPSQRQIHSHVQKKDPAAQLDQIVSEVTKEIIEKNGGKPSPQELVKQVRKSVADILRANPAFKEYFP